MQTADQFPEFPNLAERIRNGAVCIRFEACVSFVFVSLRLQSRLFVFDNPNTRYNWGIPYSLLSIFLGPWGVPWGPILTARAIWVNLSGGVDYTEYIAAALQAGNPAIPPVNFPQGTR